MRPWRIHGCCWCGCGQRTKIATRGRTSIGQVAGEPMRYVRGHRGKPPVEGFLEKVRIDENGCWRWTASKQPNGYAQFRSGLAHRAGYEMFRGPIPEGLQLDHLCRVRDCVNPDHLEPVTNRENMMRGSGWPPMKAAQTHCIHGHEFTPKNTYIRKNGTRHCKQCNADRARERWRRKNWGESYARMA